MGSPFKSRSFALAAAAGISLALLLPAQAQFWDWGNRPQRQQQQNNNPFGGWFSPSPGPRYGDPVPQAPVDSSHAPGPAQKKPEATTTILVMGDANADCMAYGLEDAFSEKPEIGIVRKHRTDSGLIRYDQRRDAVEWPQAAREIIAAEKPKFIVMMIGNNDRQTIREKAASVVRPAAPKGAQPAAPGSSATPSASATPAAPAPVDPEQQSDQAEAEPPPANQTPEQARQAAYGPWEFRSEKWERAYIKRIDATIAALKSAGVPVFWIGLPSQRGAKASADSSYLNDIYRSRADKAGIVYVDIWDGFVDEAGRFSPQGPDYEGQTRRLRSGDGVYFTKFGARKLAHYVEREVERSIASRGAPVALPVPVDPGPQAAKPGGPAQRPVAGPVVPLTAVNVSPEELLVGARAARPGAAADPTVTRVLTKGEPVAAPSGRADDFNWPRGGPANTEPAAAAPATPPANAPPAGGKTSKPAAAAPPPAAQQRPATDAQTAQTAPTTENPEPKPPVQRRARPNPNAPRPPLQILQGLFR